MSRISRRVKQPGVYFITTDSRQRRQLFLKPEPARIVVEQILECRERGFYRLHAFVLMPEHLHMLLTPGEGASLEKAIMMIKGGSSYKIKRELLYSFPIWMSGYHDRWIRHAGEYQVRKKYIDENPVRARLVEKPEDYPLGSANGKFRLDACCYDLGPSGSGESV
ncbi:MAG TPA: transposase [Candidatus Acidoferrales bacterium]|nr:transposase [Candidatus Acidoferrales bacterium]